MKANKSILKEMANGIKLCRNETEDIFNRYIKNILQSKTVEEVMATKRDLLFDLLDSVFPISGDSCYFCIETGRDCEICKFAKFHKRCETNKRSDYQKIMDAFDKLDQAFENYYRGEIYPEDEEEENGNLLDRKRS